MRRVANTEAKTGTITKDEGTPTDTEIMVNIVDDIGDTADTGTRDDITIVAEYGRQGISESTSRHLNA